MRIFVQPPHGAPVDQSVRTAYELLHNSNILSERAGGVIYDRGVVLVEAAEVPEALATLRKAGLRPVVG